MAPSRRMKNKNYQIPRREERFPCRHAVTPDTSLSTFSVRIPKISLVLTFSYTLYFPALLSCSSQLKPKSLQFFALGYASLGSCASNKKQALSNICIKSNLNSNEPNAGSGIQRGALWVNTTRTNAHVESFSALTNG